MLRDRVDSGFSWKESASALRVVVALMALAGVVAGFSDQPVIRGAAIVVVIILGLLGLAILLALRARSRAEEQTQQEFMARYCDFVIDNKMAPLVAIENWHQKVYIEPNGDVRELVLINAVALRDEVHFIRFHLGSEWDQPEEHRRNVIVRARQVGDDGMPGPLWTVTNTWLNAAKLNSIVHFRKPVRLGEEIRLEMLRLWPAKCLPLMRHRVAENFFFRTTELLQIRRAEYQVILPLGFDVSHEPVGFVEPDDHMSVDAYVDTEGRRVVVYRASRVPKQLAVGMRLELV